MLGYLRGKLLDKTFTECMVDVNGVGYELQIPLSTSDKLGLPGAECELFVHTQVREDAITLFGFATDEEKKLFRILISASGIGGKLALNILSAMPVANLCQAVVAGDVKLLSRINGVGKKTAERMIVDLKSKLADFFPEAAAQTKEQGADYNDALAAMQQLGFKREDAATILNRLIAEHKGENLDRETLIRMALAVSLR